MPKCSPCGTSRGMPVAERRGMASWQFFGIENKNRIGNTHSKKYLHIPQEGIQQMRQAREFLNTMCNFFEL